MTHQILPPCTPEQKLASLQRRLAQHKAKDAARVAKIEAARADPLTRYSQAARWKPRPIDWEEKLVELEDAIATLKAAGIACNTK